MVICTICLSPIADVKCDEWSRALVWFVGNRWKRPKTTIGEAMNGTGQFPLIVRSMYPPTPSKRRPGQHTRFSQSCTALSMTNNGIIRLRIHAAHSNRNRRIETNIDVMMTITSKMQAIIEVGRNLNMQMQLISYKVTANDSALPGISVRIKARAMGRSVWDSDITAIEKRLWTGVRIPKYQCTGGLVVSLPAFCAFRRKSLVKIRSMHVCVCICNRYKSAAA